MAIIDVVKCEMDGNSFCQKFPSEDLRIGTQLVVYTAQTAFFVKGGAICDEFTAGTHTLKTANIPLLNLKTHDTTLLSQFEPLVSMVFKYLMHENS